MHVDRLAHVIVVVFVYPAPKNQSMYVFQTSEPPDAILIPTRQSAQEHVHTQTQKT